MSYWLAMVAYGFAWKATGWSLPLHTCAFQGFLCLWASGRHTMGHTPGRVVSKSKGTPTWLQWIPSWLLGALLLSSPQQKSEAPCFSLQGRESTGCGQPAGCLSGIIMTCMHCSYHEETWVNFLDFCNQSNFLPCDMAVPIFGIA